MPLQGSKRLGGWEYRVVEGDKSFRGCLNLWGESRLLFIRKRWTQHVIAKSISLHETPLPTASPHDDGCVDICMQVGTDR